MPALNEKLDAVDQILCQMKATLQLITWLDTCGEATARHDEIMVMQHRLLADVAMLEAMLNGAEEGHA
jgi:regulator of sigma D